MAQRERESPEHAVYTVAEQAVKADELVDEAKAAGGGDHPVAIGPGRPASGGRAVIDYDGNGRFTAAVAIGSPRRRGRATASATNALRQGELERALGPRAAQVERAACPQVGPCAARDRPHTQAGVVEGRLDGDAVGSVVEEGGPLVLPRTLLVLFELGDPDARALVRPHHSSVCRVVDRVVEREQIARAEPG